jgi:hypothetical protein
MDMMSSLRPWAVDQVQRQQKADEIHSLLWQPLVLRCDRYDLLTAASAVTLAHNALLPEGNARDDLHSLD